MYARYQTDMTCSFLTLKQILSFPLVLLTFFAFSSLQFKMNVLNLSLIEKSFIDIYICNFIST